MTETYDVMDLEPYERPTTGKVYFDNYESRKVRNIPTSRYRLCNFCGRVFNEDDLHTLRYDNDEGWAVNDTWYSKSFYPDFICKECADKLEDF